MREDMSAASKDGPRLRLQGIVETAEGVTPGEWRSGILTSPAAGVRPDARWNKRSRQVWHAARLGSAFLFFSVIVGWPLGDFLAHLRLYGSLAGWSPAGTINLSTYLLATFVPILILLMGYFLSRLFEMMGAAEQIAASAQQFIHPDQNAADNAKSVGLVVREQIDSLNVGLDGALHKLAAVEAMIRDHVDAIESAGAKMEARTSGAVTRVASERARLIDLTEQLNREADAFATAIAEKAQASVAAVRSADTLVGRAENHFDERLKHLDAAAKEALESFVALGEALQSTDETIRARVGAIDSSVNEAKAATERASKAADAAAEAAARNAANVGASAARAASEAKRAADASIEAASREAERSSQFAYEAAEREAKRVAEVAQRILGDVRQSTEDMMTSMAADAGKTRAAATEMTEAAKASIEAAGRAAEDVSKASAQSRQTTEAALALADKAAQRVDARNKALSEAREMLEAENARLESLIDEQRKRADRLADAIANQTERLSKLAESQLREQEASARLAEAQLALRKKAEETSRRDAERIATERAAAEKAAAERAAAEKKAAEEARAAAEAEMARLEAESAAKAAEERAKSSRSKTERTANAIAEDAGVLDLGRASKKRGAKQGSEESAADSDEAAGTKRDKGRVSWKQILEATDEAEPLDLAAAAKTDIEKDGAADAIKIIGRLQAFTLDLETRLYGDPPAALRERFDRGDRNVFANRLLRLNEPDVKRRIRAESSRDKTFERDIHEFLQGFERLLEDATTTQTADEDLEEYLSSPLGRVYLLIGATVGYFA